MSPPNELLRPSFALFISLLAAIIGMGGCSNQGPGSTIERFYRLLEAGKLLSAEELIALSHRSSLSTWDRREMRGDLKRMNRRIGSQTGLATLRALEERISGDTAEVLVEVRFGNETKNIHIHTLVQEEGAWYLPSTEIARDFLRNAR